MNETMNGNVHGNGGGTTPVGPAAASHAAEPLGERVQVTVAMPSSAALPSVAQTASGSLPVPPAPPLRETAQPLAATPHVNDPSAPVAIEAIDLVKDYGSGDTAVHALRGVNVRFEQGRFTAIMGPSGSGKSTLMHTLAGLDSATRGRILFGGKDITRMNDNELTLLRRHAIGFIFQSFNLLPMFTAEQNILMPLTLAGAKPDRAWFDMLVATLGLRDRLNHRPNELSGGQQQRVAIARALVTKPDLVFADEPTGNLDSVSSAEVLGFLRRSVKELGRTIVMVTHDAVAASYADRAIVFADGRIVADVDHPDAETMNRLLMAERERATGTVGSVRPAAHRA